MKGQDTHVPLVERRSKNRNTKDLETWLSTCFSERMGPITYKSNCKGKVGRNVVNSFSLPPQFNLEKDETGRLGGSGMFPPVWTCPLQENLEK